MEQIKFQRPVLLLVSALASTFAPAQDKPLARKSTASAGGISRADSALKFLDENKDKPFFLYLAHWDVHGPHHALKEVVDKYQKKSQGWDNATNEKPDPAQAQSQVRQSKRNSAARPVN